jgi:hypothetical protein
MTYENTNSDVTTEKRLSQCRVYLDIVVDEREDIGDLFAVYG